MKKLGLLLISLGMIPVTTLKGESMKLMSQAFKHGERLPKKYSCEGDEISPDLQWSEVPSGTKSLTLIVDDPDAPGGTWVHWVVYTIDPTVTGLSEGAQIIKPMQQGINSSNQIKYQAACPPKGHGTHHYYFTLYALDTTLNLNDGATKQAVMQAMENHILNKATLMATYERH